MTVQPTFFDWVRSGLDWNQSPYEACSPNLGLLRKYLTERWPVTEPGVIQYLGCEGDRTVRQGVTQSEHSWGAAFDWRYPNGKGSEISTFVIDHSLELGICSIHDYLGDRIWRAGRTGNAADAHTLWWKKQNGAGSGMGESWADYFHFVTTFAAFHNATPVVDRLSTPPPPPPPEEDDMSENLIYYPTRTPSSGDPNWTVMREVGLELSGIDGEYADKAMPTYEPKSGEIVLTEALELTRFIERHRIIGEAPSSLPDAAAAVWEQRKDR